MALTNVTHKPTAAKARQFDGTYTALLDMLDARPKAGLTATLGYDGNGNLTGVQLSGGSLGAIVDVGVGDWAVFPDDLTQPAFALPGEQAGNDWQVV